MPVRSVSPQLEAVAMAALGAFTVCAAAIAWALIRLARGGDRWTDAANTLGRRVTALENHLGDLESTVDALLGPIGSTGLPGAVTGNQRQERR